MGFIELHNKGKRKLINTEYLGALIDDKQQDNGNSICLFLSELTPGCFDETYDDIKELILDTNCFEKNIDIHSKFETNTKTDNEAVVAKNTTTQKYKPELVSMPFEHNVVYRCTKCGQYMHRTSWSIPVKYCSNCGIELDWSDDE